MTNEKNSHVVMSSGCRSLHLLPGFASPALSSAFGSSKSYPLKLSNNGPFKGLVICVTGLSKEARAQVQEATERMGGEYSPDLHPRCTHLVVQSFAGRKFEHALKHGIKRGLFIVTLAWFVNCAKLHERLDESNYTVPKTLPRNSAVSIDNRLSDTSGEQVCLPSRLEETKPVDTSTSVKSSVVQSPASVEKHKPLFRGFNFYVDPCVSEDIQAKVVAAAAKEGATFADNWYIGCTGVTHVVCEKDSFLTYTGSIANLVTPLWLLKSLKEHSLQRSVQLSSDLARHLAFVVDPLKGKETKACQAVRLQPQSEREELVKLAKEGVRKRRGQRKQPCRTLPRPISPVALLDNICWSVTDLPSAAKLYVDRSPESLLESEFFDAYDKGNTSGSEPELCTRALRESERQETIYSGVFITVLFPVDRFAEMGPSSRTFFSERGFTREEMFERIYAFYQEMLCEEEINVAINTDSRHADKLRAMYGGREFTGMKRGEFIGSRRNFEGLKRLSRENTGQVYELWLGS